MADRKIKQIQPKPVPNLAKAELQRRLTLAEESAEYWQGQYAAKSRQLEELRDAGRNFLTLLGVHLEHIEDY